MKSNYSNIVQPFTCDGEDWDNFPDKLAFIPIGFPEFKRKVCRNLTTPFNQRETKDVFNEILRRNSNNLDIEKFRDFSPRQAINAASDTPFRLKRFKAVASIIMCQALAEILLKGNNPKIGIKSAEDIFKFMHIEAATAYVQNFNAETLYKLSIKDPLGLSTLRTLTGQLDDQIFFHMADKHTVTTKLAKRVAKFFEIEHPEFGIHEVSIGYNPYKKYGAATFEQFDVNNSAIEKAVSALKSAGRLKHLTVEHILSCLNPH